MLNIILNDWRQYIMSKDHPGSTNVELYQGSHGNLALATIALEDALRESESRFRGVVESLNEGIMITSLDDRVTYVNNRMVELTGYSHEELIGQIAHQLLLPQSEWQKMQCRCADRGHGVSEHYTVQLKIKSGELRWFDIKAAPYRNTDGVIIGTIGANTDIHDSKLLEEQLHQSQKMEAVGRLAGGVAHDFNNLLTAIGGYTDLALSKLEQGGVVKPEVEEIKRGLLRATALTQQLLTFSRKQVTNPQVITLNSVISGVEGMMRRLIGEDIKLSLLLDQELAATRADCSQIEQVVINLVINARDAMPNGGELTIQTSNLMLSKVFETERFTLSPGPYILLTVSDTGFGMNEKVKQHLFEPFFTTKDKGKGTGLGLSTVYGIVKQCEGDIAVTSVEGKGTTFRLYFPRVAAVPEQKAAPVIKKEVKPGTETVLLVEDEEMVRNLVSRVLQMKGYSVLEAATPSQALTLSKSHLSQIDIMLSDVVMPEMGGRELAEKIQKARPTLKIILMSGYSDDALLQKKILDANTAFLSKPFTPDQLAIKIRETLDS